MISKKIRTIVALDAEDKAWLDRRATQDRVAMTELIRQAVKLLRKHSRERRSSLDDTLAKTKGIWTSGNGLRYQRKIRNEW